MPSIVPVFETDGITYAGPVGNMSDRQNPVRELAFNKDNALKIWRLFGNAYVDIKPFKGFLFRSNFGLDYDAAFIHSYRYTFHSDIVNNDTNGTTLSQANDSKCTWTNTVNYDFTIKTTITSLFSAVSSCSARTVYGFLGREPGLFDRDS